MKKEVVQGRWGRVATRCAAIAERDEDSRREDDIIMHKDYDLSPYIIYITKGVGVKLIPQELVSQKVSVLG